MANDAIVSAALRFKLFWVLMGLLWVVAIIYLSLTSISLPTFDIGFEIDKIEHTIAYFVLMAWFGQIYHRPFQLISFAIIFINLGIVLEYLQAIGGYRIFEYADMVANATGVLLGLWLTIGWFKGALHRFEDWLVRLSACSR